MKKTAYAILATIAALTLGSCSEGKYWNEPDNMGEVVAFTKSTVQLSVAADAEAPESYDVVLYRSQADKELTVPVTFATDYPDVIKGSGESVTFEAGHNTAVYTIHIGALTPGVPFSATLEVSNPEDSFIHVDQDNLTFSFSITQALSWKSAGTARLSSSTWVEGVTATVNIEEGNWPVAGQRLFRIVDPYYSLEPDVATKGGELRFFTDDAGVALGMFQAWTFMNEENDGEYYFFGCPAAYGGSFTSEGNNYVMNGVIGYSDSENGPVSPGWYETLSFVWQCPAK